VEFSEINGPIERFGSRVFTDRDGCARINTHRRGRRLFVRGHHVDAPLRQRLCDRRARAVHSIRVEA
jgi:hypothetical protein